MGKFRNKLKGSTNRKRWAKGGSSSSNPETQKFRNQAKSRFFQENLGHSNLTSDVLRKHDAVQSILPKPQQLIERESDSEVESSVDAITFESMDSFASDWSNCSNVSFKKFFSTFQASSTLHKEMLAVLAAVTEVIKDKGGNETPTEYYCALVTVLEQVLSIDAINEDQVTAILALLNIGIKTVPNGVLQTSFDDVCKKMVSILNKFSNANNNVIVKSVLGILSSLLMAQDGGIWSLSSTANIFNVILNPFCIHHKPKWRKSAQNAAILVAKRNCLSQDGDSNRAANQVAEFCKEIIDECLKNNSSIKSSQTTILHVLGLMKDTVAGYSKINIKKSCELILQLMTLNYPLVKSCGLQVLHVLLSQQTIVISAKLNGQLISALYEYQPSIMDVQITLAWVTVMQQAHIHLADADLSLACSALPKMFETLTQLWLSEKKEVPIAATHALDALLHDAVLPLCDNANSVEQHSSKLEKCFELIQSGLGYQYNLVWNQVLHVISVMFEVAGKNGSKLLLGCLKLLAELRDSYNFSYNNELENAVGSAVKSMGPEIVLKVINLTKNSEQEINLDRSWLLPVLKENIQSATLEYWINSILPLATFCHQRSAQLISQNEGINAHVYELLYMQLWSLLPSFCRKATDIKKSFKDIAKILGVGISEHKDLRLSIMSSLRRLIFSSKESDCKEDLDEISRFDKNYLPILFNLYTTKSKDGEEEGHRLAALETVKIFLTISKTDLIKQLFENGLVRLQNTEPAESNTLYVKEAIMDLIRELVPYQNEEGIQKLYETSVKPIPKMTNKKEQQKAFRLLEEIFECESEGCKRFFKNNRKQIQKLLLKTLKSTDVISKSSRLRCLNYLIKSQSVLTHESSLIRSVVPEAILCCKDVNKKCRTAAFALLNTIGETLNSHNQLQEYLNMIVAGLAGTPQIMSATILALSSILYQFSGALGNDNIEFLLKSVGNVMSTNTREVVCASLSFIKMYCTSLPSPTVAYSLPYLVNCICNMSDDCKRNLRVKVRNILDRLVRKYGCESIIAHVPATDTIMYKRLRNLRKLNARKKREKDIKKEESDDEDEFSVNAKPKSIEEILADSDIEDSETNDFPEKNKHKKSIWIREDSDTIIDFNDPAIVNKITATRPNVNITEVPKNKIKNRGFKTAADGRLIITDIDANYDSDTDKNKLKKLNKLTLEDSETDDDVNVLDQTSNKKRRRSEMGSVKTAFSSSSQPPLKYQAGGSGIHRPVLKTPSTPGSEYKSKKAQGDIKKKGKLDPYMYLPLQRNLLNKRKRAKVTGQFKNIQKAAKAGAKKGRRIKKMKKP